MDVMALPEIMSIALRIRMSIQLRSNWLVIMKRMRRTPFVLR